MSKFSLPSALYSTGNGKTVACCPKVKIGQESDNPVCFSTNRPKASSLAKAKISSAAFLIDAVLNTENPMAGAASENLVYLEYNGTCGYIDGEHIVLNDVDRAFSVALIVMYCLHFENEPELLSEFNKCVEDNATSGFVHAKHLFAFCDAFYYGFARKYNTFDWSVVTAEEIQMRMHQETLGTIDRLSDTAAILPVNVKAEKVKKKVVQPKKSVEDVLSDCKAGVYRVNHTWDASQEEYIQSISSLEGFIPSEEFAAIISKIKFRTDRVLQRMQGLSMDNPKDRVSAIGQDYINLTLSGKPGTGKTRLGYALAAATGMPVYTIACSHNTDEDEFVGMTKMINGEATSVATDTVKCVENGGILILEEANLPQAAVMMGALGQLVEFPFILKKFGYQPIRRHPLCIIITTMNTGTAGAKIMSQPFANRFKQSFVLNDPEKKDFIRILQNTGAERTVCQWVYDCYTRIVNCVEADNGMADVESILLSLSMRSCIGAIENIQEGMAPKEAIRNSIIGKISEQDRDVAASCLKTLASVREPNF